MPNDISTSRHRGTAQSRLNEACALIGDGQNSLLTALVKATKAGELTEAKALECFAAIRQCADDAHQNYQTAIRLPEARASLAPRVVL